MANENIICYNENAEKERSNKNGRKQRNKSKRTYKYKLLVLLAQRKINKTQLREMTKLSPATMSKIVKEENITTEVISKICKALQCDVKDIMKYKE